MLSSANFRTGSTTWRVSLNTKHVIQLVRFDVWVAVDQSRPTTKQKGMGPSRISRRA